MPYSITKTAGDTTYQCPFVGPVEFTTHIKLDVSALTTAEVDAKGYLKPGVALKSDGTLLGGSQSLAGGGVVPYAVKIATGNTALAGDTSDPLVVVCTHGIVNRDIAEDNLGRAYNANELAAFIAAGSHIALTTT